MSNTDTPEFSFAEANAVYQHAAGGMYKEPSPDRSVYCRGGWVLHDKDGLVAFVNPREGAVFGANIAGMMMQLAESLAAR